MIRSLILAGALAFTSTAVADNVKIATFNTESETAGGDTQPIKVAETFASISGIDVWGLQEVQDEAALQLYLQNAGAGTWDYVMSTSGESSNPQDFMHDYLAIMYRTDLFRVLSVGEYHATRSRPGNGKFGTSSPRLRGMLYAQLMHKNTKEVFYVANVHLKCCGNGRDTREHQSKLIADWISSAQYPVVLLGDFNIPVDPSDANGPNNSGAFDALISEASWLRPSNPIKTQCSPRYNSMLDLIFYSGDAANWSPEGEVLKTDATYCVAEENGYADHRPVVGTFKLP